MASSNNPKLKTLFKFLDKSFEKRINSIVVTFPGLGYSHILKQYSNKNKVNYIENVEDRSGSMNIIDIDLSHDENQILEIDSYFRKNRSINPKNTFVFVLNSPSLIHKLVYQSSTIARHVYQTYYFATWEKIEIKDFINEQDIKVSNDALEKIYSLSGGIPRIVKFLIFNKDCINKPISEYASKIELLKLINPTLKIFSTSRISDLEKLGIFYNQNFKSKIVEYFFDNGGYKLENFIDLEIFDDLSFSEKGSISDSRLTKFEKDFIGLLFSNNNVITRDKIAETKWGEESFDNFSDQAINQAVTRLNKKLKFYKIKSIPKVGYKMTS